MWALKVYMGKRKIQKLSEKLLLVGIELGTSAIQI